jgi:hypothetical protein
MHCTATQRGQDEWGATRGGCSATHVSQGSRYSQRALRGLPPLTSRRACTRKSMLSSGASPSSSSSSVSSPELLSVACGSSGYGSLPPGAAWCRGRATTDPSARSPTSRRGERCGTEADAGVELRFNSSDSMRTTGGGVVGGVVALSSRPYRPSPAESEAALTALAHSPTNIHSPTHPPTPTYHTSHITHHTPGEIVE